MKNMKIEINDEQPLSEVVEELDRLGYKRKFGLCERSIFVCTFGKIFVDCVDISYDDSFKLTTLSELRGMK